MSGFGKILADKRGESLVEVICAAAIFLIALTALHGGVRFAHSAMEKAGELRTDAAEFHRELEDGDAFIVGAEEYVFYLTEEDGTTFSEEAFRVTVGLGEKTVIRNGEDPVSFAVFCPLVEGG